METKNVLIGTRPTLPKEYRDMIRDLTDKMNESALVQFTGHDILLLCIDRAHQASFPERKNKPKRKKYVKIDF